MRILVYNWRDIQNPLSGGAEEYVHQIFSRLSEMGHEVTIFTSGFKTARGRERVGGIRVIRKGGKFSVYLYSVIFYLRHRKEFDVVIDSVNTIPFFTPFFVKIHRLSIFHHIGGMETYRLEAGLLTSILLTALQKITLILYRREKVITVSESTRKELLKSGMSKKNVVVIHNGVSSPVTEFREKFEDPTIIYFGRVKRLKRIDELLRVFRIVQNTVANARLLVAGKDDKEYVNWLKSLVSSLDLANVLFIGKVNLKEKDYYLSRSWVYAITSVKEGWGISVLEANAVGLPVVAYRVPGLLDSVREGLSGFLAPDEDRDAFASLLTRILKNEKLREQFSVSAREWASRFDWNLSSAIMNQLLFHLNS